VATRGRKKIVFKFFNSTERQRLIIPFKNGKNQGLTCWYMGMVEKNFMVNLG
jgi:hypothetical protein